MRDPQLADRIGAALMAAGIAPHWLTLEITEHVMVVDATHSLRQVDRLRGMGCRVAIDDFGTGYSAISYLKQLPVDELKIDRSFVTELGENPKDEIIVRSVVDLAHRFGLSVTAEGVETDAAWALLTSIGCDAIQGYLLARPLTAEDMGAWLDERQGRDRVAPDCSRLSVV
jgi:diguanylate cyclase